MVNKSESMGIIKKYRLKLWWFFLVIVHVRFYHYTFQNIHVINLIKSGKKKRPEGSFKKMHNLKLTEITIRT